MKAAAALIGLLAVAVAAPGADQPPALIDLLVLTGEYVRGFQVDLASIIGDEKYRQSVRHIETKEGQDYTLMEVSHGRDAKLGGWLPVRMEETYSQTRNGGAIREEIHCVATYADDRRFKTSARIVAPK